MISKTIMQKKGSLKRCSRMGHFQHQNGSILFISMVLMTSLAILGISSMRTALTEEKISQNVQDLNIATEAAESGLRFGQQLIKNANQRSFNPGFYKSHVIGASYPDLIDWAEDSVYVVPAGAMRVTGAEFTSASPQRLPRFIVEEFFVPDIELDMGDSTSLQDKEPRSTSYFRVISRGLGLSGENEILLESVVIEQTR